MNKSLYLLLPFCLALGASAQQQTNSIALTWNWTPPTGQSVSSYVFLLRSTNNVAAPLPWPIIAQSTGTLQLAASLPMVVGETRYMYIGVTDPRSNGTNFIAEAPPSNIVQTTILPGTSGATISRGP